MGDQPTSIEEREARIGEIDQRLAEIDEEHANSLMPDHVREEWNQLNGERDEHAATVAELRRRRERLQNLAGNQNATERAATGTPSFVRKPGEDEIYDVTAARFQSRSEEEFRDRLHANARRAIERASFPGQSREAAQTRASQLLDTVDDAQGNLARRMLITGSPVYDRAFGKAVMARSTNGLSGEELRALSVGSDPDGGYAVPFQLDPTVILSSDGSDNPLRRMSRVEPIVGKEWQGVTSAGIVVTRVPEVQEATDDSPTLDQPVVRPSAVHGFVPFSMDVDQDWTRLRTEISRLLADAKDNEEADSFVNGDGALITGGGHNPEGVVAGLPASSHVLSNGGGVGAASFGVADVYAVKNALPPRFRRRGQFLAETAIYDEVRQFDESGGSSLWVQLQDGRPPRLIGYPAEEVSTMSSTIDNDEHILLFGDFQQFLIVDRIGMSVELVPHLFGATNRFPTGQRGVYARWRNSTKILVDNAFRLLVVNAAA